MRAREIAHLAEEARKIQSSHERDLFFNSLFSLTRDLLKVPFVGLWVRDPLKGNIRRLFTDSEPPSLDTFSVAGGIVSSKRPFVSSEIRSVPNWRRRKWSDDKGLISYAGVPIIINRKAVGALSVLDEKHRVFRSRELQTLRKLSDVAGIMLSRSRPDLSPKSFTTDCNLCFVREESVLSCLSGDQIKDFEKLKRVRNYPKDSVIFFEGDAASGLYIVRSGRVKLVKTDEEGRSVIIRVANPGELLDRITLFSNQPYPYTALALEKTQVAYLPKEEFLRFLGSNCAFFQALSCNISAELELYYQRHLKSAFNENKRYLAAEILNLCKTYGQVTPEGILVNIDVRYADLAEMIGTSTRTVLRVITFFKNQEIIHIRRHKIIVRDESRLRTYAGELF